MAVWEPLIKCGMSPGSGVNSAYLHECNFADLVVLVKDLITDLVFISTLLAVMVFIWAGFNLLTAGGKSGALDDAKKMLMNVLKGYLWILAAWLIVYTITSVLLNPNMGYSFLGSPK